MSQDEKLRVFGSEVFHSFGKILQYSQVLNTERCLAN
jgi:hypothetical protein